MINAFNNMMRIAGDSAPAFRRTLCFSCAAAVVQALSWGIMLPLFYLLLQEGPLPLHQTLSWLGLLLITLCAEALLRVVEMRFSYDYWPRVTEALRLRLASRLRLMPLEQLAQRKTGDLAMVLGNNVTMAATAVSSLATLAVQLVAVPCVLLLLILALDWRLGIFLLVACLAVIPLLREVQRRANRDFQSIDDADAQASAAVVEYVQGLAVLRATGKAGCDAPCLSNVFRHQHQAQEATQSTTRLLAKAQLIIQLALVATVGIAVWLVLSQQLSLAALLCITVVAAQLAEPITTGLAMIRLFELADAALKRVNELLAEPELMTREPLQQPRHGEIRMENVSWRYQRSQRPVINALSLTIAEKSFTALVGPSGGGKTTITRLLSRFADPQQGEITFGGVSLRHIPPQQLLSAISVVFQDVWLMDDTLARNIALGKPDASHEEIVAAARRAHVHHAIIRLPQGYETRAGEAGSALSGGERQRISIARAILKDAPVVLLDEPTSSLDSESEYQVQRAIEALVVDKTVVIVAHRLSTIRAADQIIYIDDGRCLECGTHDSLMARSGGHYRQMVEAQYHPQS